MTNGQTSGSESPMEGTAENTGDVSGMMNLTINLPDNVRISTVDSDETEESEGASANATGTIVAFAGAAAPNGWLLCNGAAVSRATYADLFTVMHELRRGQCQHDLQPAGRGRFALGKDDMGGVVKAAMCGSSSGAEKHTLTVPAATDSPPRKQSGVASKEDDHSSPYTATTNATAVTRRITTCRLSRL